MTFSQALNKVALLGHGKQCVAKFRHSNHVSSHWRQCLRTWTTKVKPSASCCYPFWWRRQIQRPLSLPSQKNLQIDAFAISISHSPIIRITCRTSWAQLRLWREGSTGISCSRFSPWKKIANDPAYDAATNEENYYKRRNDNRYTSSIPPANSFRLNWGAFGKEFERYKCISWRKKGVSSGEGPSITQNETRTMTNPWMNEVRKAKLPNTS